jgi:tetratricopeptide (TPR) repeat protein
MNVEIGKNLARVPVRPFKFLIGIPLDRFGAPAYPGTPSQKRHSQLAFFFLAAITLTAYSNSFQAGFAQDSRGIILEDPRLQAANGENLRKILQENYWWPQGESGLYRPVTTASYLFNYSLLGNEDRAPGYHWINFLLHLGNSFLVYLLAWRLFRNTRPALATAALWALHPICTEAVTNIVGRADELAALSVLLTILIYIRSTEARGWRRAAWLTGMAVTTTIGIFSKENALIVCALLPLYDLSFRISRRRGNPVRNIFEHLARYCSRGYVVLVLPLLAFICVRGFMFQRDRPVQMPFVDNPILRADLVTARLTAIKVFGKALWLLLWPSKLSCDYSFNQIPLVNWRMTRFEDWQALASLAAIFALVAIAAACRRRAGPAFFWIGFVLLTMLPTSNLLQPIGSIMAERFLYLPAVGFAGCLVAAACAAERRLRLGQYWIPFVAVFVALACGVRTFERNRDWADDEALWRQALTVAPMSFKPHISLAQIWFQQEGSSPRVLSEAEKAVAILDKLPDRFNVAMPYQDLGLYYLSKGDSLSPRGPDGDLLPSPESRQWYHKALAVLQRGVAIDRELNAAGRHVVAVREKKSATLPTFGLAPLYADLGLVYLRLSAPTEAVTAYLYQRKITPGDPRVYWSLAAAYSKTGQTQAAFVALWGAFVLGRSAETTPYLLRLYDDLYPQSCATYFHEGHEFLNTACPLVQGHQCSALLEVAAAHSEEGQVERAKEIQDGAGFRSCRSALR